MTAYCGPYSDVGDRLIGYSFDDWIEVSRWNPLYWLGYTWKRQRWYHGLGDEPDGWQYARPVKVANVLLRERYAPVVVATRSPNEQSIADSSKWTGR